MSFHSYAVATTVEGTKQVIPQSPVAALEIIKNLARMERILQCEWGTSI